MKEQREHQRFQPPRDNPVEVQIIGYDFFEVLYLKSKDIGAGGISIYVPHNFKGCTLNKEVELVITLPGDIPFKAQGVIRHKKMAGDNTGYFGVYFTKVNEADRAEIEKFVRKNIAP